jgi:hypothetical protein
VPCTLEYCRLARVDTPASETRTHERHVCPTARLLSHRTAGSRLVFLAGLLTPIPAACKRAGSFADARTAGQLTCYGSESPRLNTRRTSILNDGSLRVLVILIGMTVRPSFRNSGSTAFSKSDFQPVVVCDTLASMNRLPLKASTSRASEYCRLSQRSRRAR